MAKKVFNNVTFGKKIDVDEIDEVRNRASQKTQLALDDVNKNPSEENIDNAIITIKQDSLLSREDKDIIIQHLNQNIATIIKTYNFYNCPNDDIALENESIQIYELIENYDKSSNYLWVVFGQRLAKIEDRFKEKNSVLTEKYDNFNNYMTTAYPDIDYRTYRNYIQINREFSEFLIEHSQEKLDYSKFRLALSTVRKFKDRNRAEKFKNEVFTMIENNESVNKIKDFVDKEKNYINASQNRGDKNKTTVDDLVNKFLKDILKHDVTEKDKDSIRNLIEKLEFYIK